MTITINTDNLRGEIAPLYHRYQGQTNAQPAYVELDEDGVVRADYNPEIGPPHAIPFSVFHRRDLRWGVANAIRGDALAYYLESAEALALLERIHAGHDVEWDGNNNVGKLDDDAAQAEIDFEAALQALGESEDNMGAVWEVGEWLQNLPFSDDLWATGKTLPEAVTAIEEAAEAERVELDGDIERYLLDRAERANEQGKCYRPEVLAALHADGRNPVDENGDGWEPSAKAGQG